MIVAFNFSPVEDFQSLNETMATKQPKYSQQKPCLDRWKFNIEGLGDRGGNDAGDSDGSASRIQNQKFHGLGSAVRRHKSKVNHLLGAVDSWLRGDLHFQGKIKKLGSSCVCFYPEIWKYSLLFSNRNLKLFRNLFICVYYDLAINSLFIF